MAKTQEYDLGEFTFPRGWFVVAECAQISKKPFNAHYFGQDLVIYRGESGKVGMLDAYCPHMGTHFGKCDTSFLAVTRRQIEGDSIRCPFHGWRFGPDGKCNDIPYFDGPIPKQATVRPWTVVERYGLVFCWNDPEGLAPDSDLPAFPEWDDPLWVRWERLDHLGDMTTHPIEVVDNTSDVRHLHYLHGGNMQSYDNEVDGPFLIQCESQRPMWHGADGDAEFGQTMTTISRYTGSGLLTGRWVEAKIIELIAHTPIDAGVTRLWQCSMKKSTKAVVDDEVVDEARKINASLVQELGHDVEVWAHKRPALQVMQLPTDGPFQQSRV